MEQLYTRVSGDARTVTFQSGTGRTLTLPARDWHQAGSPHQLSVSIKVQVAAVKK